MQLLLEIFHVISAKRSASILTSTLKFAKLELRLDFDLFRKWNLDLGFENADIEMSCILSMKMKNVGLHRIS